MKTNIVILLTLFATLFFISCEENDSLLEPDLEAVKRIKDTEILLRNNLWGFNDLIVNVKYEMRAIPLLANIADQDGMVQPGQYNSYEIFGDDNRQKNYSYQFTTAKIYRDTTGGDKFYQAGFYNVLNSYEIRMNPDSTVPMNYTYIYQEDKGLFTMSADHLTNSKINEAINKIITTAIYSGVPNDIANAVVDKILGNEAVQDSIQQLLYDMVHGKIDEIANSPEEVSQKLAELILQKLKEVDWETLVYNKVFELLNELKVENPEQRALELAEQISNRIETNISQADIYNAILPILQNFENEILPQLVPVIAEAIYSVIANKFSEENIYNKIYPIWSSFSQVDSTTIAQLADTLGSVITDHFFDEEDLAASLVPFMETLRTTSTLQIPALAKDIIDNVLMPLVDNLNATFPGLELDPDWNSVKQILTSALTVLKSTINGQTNEEAAAALAESIIVIMDSIISNGVESAIFNLQDIPANQASQVIAAWIANLVEVAEPQIVAFLEIKLNELADLFNAEDVAENLSVLIHDKILEVFSTENIYNLVLPLMEQLSEINIEAAAQKITDWLFDLGIIKDNVSEEQVLNALTEIISQLISNINVDEASQKLVDRILQSGIVENIDGSVLKKLIEFKTYEFLIELQKEINSIDKIEIRIFRK
jgi:hypothetical protein